MLIELWEKLRGYDKWVETTPTSVELDREQYFIQRKGMRVSEYRTVAVLSWLDLNGREHAGHLQIADDLRTPRTASSSIRLRYNPSAPDEFYARDFVPVRIAAAVERLKLPFVVFALFVLFVISIILRQK